MQISSATNAIVTGAASGLGAATAELLASKGAHVTIFDVNEEAGEARAKAIGGSFTKVDVTDAGDVDRAVNEVPAPRILVNCAGIAPAQRTVGREGAHDPALFKKVIEINLIGAYFVSSMVANRIAAEEPLNEDCERGVIINTASVAAYDGQIGQAAYAASKAGIAGLTLPLARDLMKLGIRSMSIAPGIFGTPMLKAMPQEVQDSLAAQVPFPARLGEPEEYAKLACHIIENTMLNGEVIRLDGAIRMGAK